MGRPRTSYLGMRVADLLVIAEDGDDIHMLCNLCGRDDVVYSRNSFRGRYSCGCLQKSQRGGYATPYGTVTDENRGAYNSWNCMINRCYGKNPGKRDRQYQARGIIVCDRWRRFENFYADMGNRPQWHTLDRVNNKGNYEPGNCKWSTYHEQMVNRF